MTLLKHIANTDLMDLVKVKYHIMETTFTILQLFDHVNDITEECACVVAMHLCNKLFGNNFQVCFGLFMVCLTSTQSTLMVFMLI